MKKLIVVCVMFLLVGGGVGALWFFKVPPFGKPVKKAPVSAEHKAESTTADTAQSAATEAEASGGSDRSGGSDGSDGSDGSGGSGEADTADRTTSASPAPAAAAKQPTRVSESDLTRMASVYEQMPVDDAARIFAKLPDELVEPMLRRMDEKQVGKLLVILGPERAAKLTVSMTKESPQLAAAP